MAAGKPIRSLSREGAREDSNQDAEESNHQNAILAHSWQKLLFLILKMCVTRLLWEQVWLYVTCHEQRNQKSGWYGSTQLSLQAYHSEGQTCTCNCLSSTQQHKELSKRSVCLRKTQRPLTLQGHKTSFYSRLSHQLCASLAGAYFGHGRGVSARLHNTKWVSRLGVSLRQDMHNSVLINCGRTVRKIERR